MLDISSEIISSDSVESPKYPETTTISSSKPKGKVLIINGSITIRPSISSSDVCE